MHLEHASEVGVGDGVERLLAAGDAGVVHQDVDLADLPARRFDGLGDGGRIAHVPDAGHGATAGTHDLCHGLVGRRRIKVIDDHRRAALGEHGELGAGVFYDDWNDNDAQTTVYLQGAYYLESRIGVTAGFSSNDDADAFTVGVRFVP